MVSSTGKYSDRPNELMFSVSNLLRWVSRGRRRCRGGRPRSAPRAGRTTPGRRRRGVR
ncbi:hypothetical protein DFR74_11952 [Nocardia puris]|uniref:Uncharacterized protein n=1 Tax=Nocardia puris TaxID=208602 RepID=A0A366CZ63_9NOCA|nr:hypothetical protein DFR74_11952 [Nocardia puris]